MHKTSRFSITYCKWAEIKLANKVITESEAALQSGEEAQDVKAFVPDRTLCFTSDFVCSKNKAWNANRKLTWKSNGDSFAEADEQKKSIASGAGQAATCHKGKEKAGLLRVDTRPIQAWVRGCDLCFYFTLTFTPGLQQSRLIKSVELLVLCIQHEEGRIWLIWGTGLKAREQGKELKEVKTKAEEDNLSHWIHRLYLTPL